MTLSFNKLNEIAELYESIADSEQEQLDEAVFNKATTDANSKLVKDIGNIASSAWKSINTPIRKSEAKPEPAKYKSSSDGKMYANYNDEKAARDSRLRDLAATQAAAKVKPPATTPAKPPATTPAKPPATTPKVLPTKPAAPAKPAMGTTAGGTKFERRAATSAELKAAQDARAAAKAAGNTKGAEEAAVKASVAAGKSTLKQSFEYDAYDLVLEYLLSQGHAETVAEAQYLMTEMDAEMIGDIVEVRMDPRGRPASGPMNVYAKSKGKPDQAHLDAVKAYDEKQKKKTPEQRKKELDDYKERQRNR